MSLHNEFDNIPKLREFLMSSLVILTDVGCDVLFLYSEIHLENLSNTLNLYSPKDQSMILKTMHR